MKDYKLIAFDMDGTLLTSKNTISVPVREALDEAVDKGKTVIICTGRSYRELMDYDQQEFKKIRYYICENGALIFDSIKREVIAKTCIPEELVLRILDLAELEDVMVYLAVEGQNLVNQKDALRMEYFHAERYKDIELRSAVLCDDIIQRYREYPVPVEKMNLYSASVGLRDKFSGLLEKLPLSLVHAEETGLEIMAPDMSKAAGFLKLCDYLKIPIEETIAVGDSDNDVDMIKAAGLGIAMGNARTCVKEVCDIMVSDNDHDGCAEAVKQYLLNNK